MAENNLFQKYRARIAREGIVKALLCGISIGCGVLALTELLSWFFGFKAGLWVGIALFFVTAGALTPIFYLKKFRPTSKAIAKRVDELGLEERVLTMMELENDDSYIAMKQREDTKKALGAVNHMLVKIAVSVSLIVAFAITGVVGISMTTVDALYYAGVIESGVSLLSTDYIFGEFTVTYTVGQGEGTIIFWTEDWADEQEVTEALTVKEGESAPAVLAVPQPGWAFVGWSDGYTGRGGKLSPYRQDVNVQSNLAISALFEEVDNSVDADSVPPEERGSSSSSSQSSGEGGGPSSGTTSPNNQRDADNNQILDGDTFYGDPFADAWQNAMDRLGSNSNVSDDMKGSVSDYFDSIAQNGSDGDE